SGILLLGGFLFPWVITVGETRVVWPWSAVGQMTGSQAVGTLLSPFLGGAVLVAARLFRGPRLALLLAWMAGLVWILTAILSPGTEGVFFSKHSPGAISVFTLMPLGACAIAIGNHLRKRFPGDPLPRFLAASGGGLLVVCYLVPMDGGTSLMATLFQPMVWRMIGSILVVFVGLFIYAALGVMSLKRLRDEKSYTRLVSILARALLWGAPLTLLYAVGLMTQGWGLGTALVLTLKLFAGWYGHWILLAASVAALIGDRLAAGRAPGRAARASAGTRARPANPPAGPATS
ncbi:MAG TPA: hypothetical protein VEN81_02260, partial [Planctomycetota bacterium]|nr:hypothetical protein [Planctomycetota bacterium]